MDDVLYLHSSDQVPFGKLSPLYRERLKINQEEASNIISYSYAGLLKKGGRRNVILLENGNDARVESLKYFREEKDELYNESMYNALFEKVKQNPYAKKNLLDSGDSIIVYQSENLFLGVNSSGQGKNIIGSMLMKIRTVVQKQVIEDNKRKFQELVQLGKYNVYIVYKSLSERIQKGIDDLSNYIGKMPDQIIDILKLSPFPGKFDVELPEELIYFLHYPTTIAEVLRNKYADEYNDQLVVLKKREILISFLIKNATEDLPSNHKELYDRYRKLKEFENKEFDEEYQTLSKIFRPIVSEMNSFIENLGKNVSELEDRLYFLASQNMLEGITSNIEKPKIEISEEYIERQRVYRDQELEKLLSLLKEYKKEVVSDDTKTKEIIEKQKKAFREAEEKFYKLEKNYMKEAAKIAEYEYMKRKGFEPDSDESSESESESDDESEEEFQEKIERLHQKYKQNYKNIYKEVQQAKRYLKNKDETQKLLEEYNKRIPKRPFIWKRFAGKKDYELTASDEVILDDAIGEIVPIKNKPKPKILLEEIEDIPIKGKTQRFPVSKVSGKMKRLSKNLPPKLFSKDLYDKKEVFDILLKYSSAQEDLKEIPVLVESFISKKESSGNIYRFSDSDPLSPSYIDFLEINNFIFPNVYYYIYFRLLLEISPKADQSMFITHNILLIDPTRDSSDIRNFKPINELVGIYNNFESLFVSEKLTKRAEKALNEKFRYMPNSPKDSLSKLCKLLIATYPKQLTYDSNDLILGFSKGQGYNIIGQIMMGIRNDLLIKYGVIRIDDIKEEIKDKERRERKPLSEFAQEKTNELLYVLSIYVDYIKDNTDIKEEDVLFVLDIIYKNCTLRINKIFESMKNIPPIPFLFERNCIKFLKDANYTINKPSLEKLWSYIYILNELYYLEIIDKDIDLFDTKKIGSFGREVEFADVEWFISSVKKLQDIFGNVDISLGIKYEVDGKIKSKSINRKNIYEFKDKNLDEYYNNTIMKLDKTKGLIKDIFIVVYETPISVIRKRYVKEKEKTCTVSKYIDDEKKDKEGKLYCVVETFRTILKKLKNIKNSKNLEIIEENVVNDTILLFINRLLSISGSIYRRGFSIENLSTYENKEDEDQLYEASLSNIVKNMFIEKGFIIKNIDSVMILLKNLAYHPNSNDVMTRVLSFSDKKDQEEIEIDKEEEGKKKKKKKIEVEEEEEEKPKKKKRFTEEDDDDEEEEKEKKKKKTKYEDEEEDEKKKKKRLSKLGKIEEDEEEDEDEGYDINFGQINSDQEEDEDEEDLFDEGEEDLFDE